MATCAPVVSWIPHAIRNDRVMPPFCRFVYVYMYVRAYDFVCVCMCLCLCPVLELNTLRLSSHIYRTGRRHRRARASRLRWSAIRCPFFDDDASGCRSSRSSLCAGGLYMYICIPEFCCAHTARIHLFIVHCTYRIYTLWYNAARVL